ncbi:MAG: chemotaxis protein CheW [Angelakisella sp.]
MSDNLNEEFLQQEEDDLAGKYLTFCVDSKIYGVELMHVKEIISIQSITAVPSTPDYVKGIINLRGGIVPVIEVRSKFNIPAIPYDERTCIIVLNISEMNVGLIVDEVSEVIEFEELSALPEVGKESSASQYIKSVAEVKDKLVLNLDCEKFLNSDLIPTRF